MAAQRDFPEVMQVDGAGTSTQACELCVLMRFTWVPDQRPHWLAAMHDHQLGCMDMQQLKTELLPLVADLSLMGVDQALRSG